VASLTERALRGALLFYLAAAGAAPTRAAEPIVIGEINPLTGALALQGTTVHQGIVLAIEEQNARGGIAGRRLILLSRDDEGRPGRGNRYFFRVSSLAGYVRPMTGFVESGLGARRVALLYSPTPGATQLARRQREIFDRAGVRVLVYVPLAAGLTDFGPLLKRVGDQAADALSLGDRPPRVTSRPGEHSESAGRAEHGRPLRGEHATWTRAWDGPGEVG